MSDTPETDAIKLGTGGAAQLMKDYYHKCQSLERERNALLELERGEFICQKCGSKS